MSEDAPVNPDDLPEPERIHKYFWACPRNDCNYTVGTQMEGTMESMKRWHQEHHERLDMNERIHAKPTSSELVLTDTDIRMLKGMRIKVD